MINIMLDYTPTEGVNVLTEHLENRIHTQHVGYVIKCVH